MARIVPSLLLAKTGNYILTSYTYTYTFSRRSRIFLHTAFFARHYSLLARLAIKAITKVFRGTVVFIEPHLNTWRVERILKSYLPASWVWHILWNPVVSRRGYTCKHGKSALMFKQWMASQPLCEHSSDRKHGSCLFRKCCPDTIWVYLSNKKDVKMSAKWLLLLHCHQKIEALNRQNTHE